MKPCPHCGAPLTDEALFCIYCMNEVEEKAPLAPAKDRKRKMRVFTFAVSAGAAVIALCAVLLLLHLPKNTPAQPGAVSEDAPAASAEEAVNPEHVAVYSDAQRFRSKGGFTSDVWFPEKLTLAGETDRFLIYTCPGDFMSCTPTVYFKKDGTDVIVALFDLFMDQADAFLFDEQSKLIDLIQNLQEYVYQKAPVKLDYFIRRISPSTGFEDRSYSEIMIDDKNYDLLSRVGAGKDEYADRSDSSSNWSYLTTTWDGIGSDNRFFYFNRTRFISGEGRIDAILYFTFGGEELP